MQTNPSDQEAPGAEVVMGSGFRETLDRANQLYAARRRPAIPDHHELEALARTLGRKLVGEPSPMKGVGDYDRLCSHVGLALIRGFHQDLSRKVGLQDEAGDSQGMTSPGVG